MYIAIHLKQPTQKQRGQRLSFSIWSCSRWGLPCRKLLPVTRCALTAPFHPYPGLKNPGRYLSAALAVGFHPPGVTWHPALWSPDFPLCLHPLMNACTAIAQPTSDGDYNTGALLVVSQKQNHLPFLDAG